MVSKFQGAIVSFAQERNEIDHIEDGSQKWMQVTLCELSSCNDFIVINVHSISFTY